MMRPVVFFLLALALLLTSSVSAQGADFAGIVIVASGQVEAVNDSGEARSLRRRSKLYQGDTLNIGVDSKAQVRFRDGTILSLRAETALRVDRFQFETADNDESIFTLLRGGFKTITGAIPKKDPRKHTVRTPVATIGVRGTHYGAVMGDSLYVGVWEGGIKVSNDKGSIDLGLDRNYNFAVVSGADLSPKGTLKPPAVLLDTVSLQHRQRRQNGESQEGETREALASEEHQQRLRKEAADKPVNDALLPVHAPLDEEVVVLHRENLLEAMIDRVVDEQMNSASMDLRFGDGEREGLDRVGLLVGAGEQADMRVTALANDGSPGRPTFADTGFEPSQAEFYDLTTDVNKVIRHGTAPVSVNTDSLYDISYGQWQGTTLSPVIVQDDALNRDSFIAFDDTVYWLTTVATNQDTLAAMSGIRAYTYVNAFEAGAHVGNVAEVTAATRVSLDSGAVSSFMGVEIDNGDFWNMQLSGTLEGSHMVLSAENSSMFVDAGNDANVFSASGNFIGELSGENAEALAAIFDFEAVSDPSMHTEGVLVAYQDQRLSPNEVVSLDRLGFAVQGHDDVSLILGGRASDGASGSPIITSNGLKPSDPHFISAGPVEVMRQDIPATSVSTDSLYDVSWGIWSVSTTSPARVQTSATDSEQQFTLNDPVFWMTFQPTDYDVASSFTGVMAYRNTVAVQGGTNEGNISPNDVFVAVKLDFENGFIDGDIHLHTDVGNFWDVVFDGAIRGSELELNVGSASELIHRDDGQLSVEGVMGGSLVGGSGEGLVAYFDFQTSTGNLHDIDGTLLVDNTDVGDRRLDGVTLDRLGFAAIDADSEATFQGFASDPVDLYIAEEFINTDTGYADRVLRPGLTNEVTGGSTTIAGSQIDWGMWDTSVTPADKMHDPNDPLIGVALMDDVYWITVEPTSDADLSALASANKTGNWTGSVPYIQGGDTFGAVVSTASFGALVDFNSGAITSANMTVDTSSSSWNVDFFDSSLNGARVNLTANPSSSSVTDIGSVVLTSPSAVDGEFSGAIVGDGVTDIGISGAFRFDAQDDPGVHVDGTFTAPGFVTP